MKHVFLLLIIALIFSSCKKEKIVVSGHWMDRKTGLTFNPYHSSIVRLVFDQSYGHSEKVGSCEVDENGYYVIAAKTRKVNVEARRQLKVDDTGKHNIDHHITLKNRVGYDFILS